MGKIYNVIKKNDIVILITCGDPQSLGIIDWPITKKKCSSFGQSQNGYIIISSFCVAHI
jgi:hypothetical protein